MQALSHLGENMHAELHVLNGLCKDIAVRSVSLTRVYILWDSKQQSYACARSSGNYEHKSISRDSRMSFRLKDFESVS